ncbi:MAG: T9SS type A sorting domain-containing protein, partial [Bacteroidetes bacterium]|nr:T9SS type A sorting domain-containing protein [Bacteroidota bacterium]
MAALQSRNRIFACLANGFYLSDDGGTTWTKPSTSGAPGNALMQEVKIDKNGIVYVTNSSNVWRSDDGGDNFVNITPKAANTTGGAFSGSRRISIAVGYSNTDYVYIMVADGNERLAGIFQSKDKGATWTRIASKAQNGVDFDPIASTASAQGVYDNVIAVDPTNENRVFAAGVELWEWLNPDVYPNNPKNGWRNTTSGFINKYNPLYLHSDVHSIVFDVNHGSPFNTFIGTDGGITKSDDGCNTFKYMNRGYNVTQFYGLAVNPLSKERGWEKKVFGGTQDNSCVLITGKGNTPMTSVTISGGDGFQCEGSQIYPEIMFYGSQNGGYMRSGNGGIDAQRMYDCRTIWQMDVAYGYGSTNKCEDKVNDFIRYFNVPMRLKEKWADTTSLMAICANKQDKTGGAIFITKDAIDLKKQTGALWYNLYESNAYFHKIEITNDMKTIYAATGGTLIQIQGFDTINYPQDTKDSAWKVKPTSINVKTIGTFGNRFITGIAEDKNDPKHLVVSLGNYGYTDHVYESKDGGANWTNISGNTMLTFPVYDVIISNENAKTILVATEFGVFGTKDGGLTWTEQNNGMAKVPVLQIRQYQDKPWEGPTLYIATHGRGIFKSNTLQTSVPTVASRPLNAKLTVYPNPTADNVNIEYNAKQTGTSYITIVDIKGNLVYNADYRVSSPGVQRIVLNTSEWASGNYLIYLKSNDGEQYQTLSVIR